ncbi:MAG: hypothetical protein JXJ04_01430 [Spirochaetales bacterium]|nr:hypothetical protein [Spirochaetales bacterium]
MNAFALWLNFLAFALMCTALSFNVVSYKRFPAPWKLYYIHYMACYGIWLLISSFLLFSINIIMTKDVVLPRVIGYFRIVLSFYLFFMASSFIFTLSGKRKLREWIFTIVPLFILLVMIIFLLLWPNRIISTFSNIYFNGCLLGFAIFGLLSVKKKKHKGSESHMIPFLYLSIVAYGMLIIDGIILFFVEPNPSLSQHSIAAGLFCGSWAILDILLFFRSLKPSHMQRGKSHLHEFIDYHNLSPREGEIIERLIRGENNKEIAEALFISERTAETHVYNIFKKCNVKNRIDLIQQFLKV